MPSPASDPERDEREFVNLLVAHQSLIRAFVISLLPGTPEVDDVIQNTNEVLFRDLPFGENSRTSKRTLYQIQDPALRFCFSVHSPHRSLWRTYPPEKKNLLIHRHAASVFEDWCRTRFPGAGRYWEKNLEIDVVAPDPDVVDRLLVGEAKWSRLNPSARQAILRDLKAKWTRCAMAS